MRDKIIYCYGGSVSIVIIATGRFKFRWKTKMDILKVSVVSFR